MAIQEFLTCLPSVPRTTLAEGAGRLVHTYLYGDLSEPEREDARQALTLLVDHASPDVRRALAEGLACAENVPHYMVHTLANDSSDLASIILARSPVLSDAELVDCLQRRTASRNRRSHTARGFPRPFAPRLPKSVHRKP